MFGCFGFNRREKTKADKQQSEIFNRVLDKWTDKGSPLQTIFDNNPSMFKRMYENVTGKDFDYGAAPSVKELRLLEKKTDRFYKGITKNPHAFAKWFYLPEEILKNNPYSERAMKSFIIHHNQYRGDMQKYSRNLNDIVSELNNAMQVSALNAKGYSLNKARKELQKREGTFQDLIKKGEHDAAYKYWQENLANLTKDGELAIFSAAEKIFRDPEKLKDPKVNETYGVGIVEAARSWHKMRGVLQKDLTKSFGEYVEILRKYETSENNISGVVRAMEKLQNTISEKGFLPHQAMDIFPTVHKINEAINQNLTGKDLTDISRFAGNLTESITKKIKPGSELFRANLEKAPGFYSKDLVSILDGYTKGVTRFVYQTKMTKSYLDAIQKLSSMSPEGMGQHAQFLMNYLRDTHSTALGMHLQNSKLQNTARIITSFEFISKLGFNMRGALRNSTQSLQNFVYFGGKAVRDANRIINSREGLSQTIEKEMKEHGLFFAEVEELAGARHTQGEIKFDEKTGTYYEDVGSVSQKVIRGMEKAAQFTSEKSALGIKAFSMQGVENMNRAWTFKIAFAKKWNELSKRQDLLEKRIKSNPENFKGEEISDKINNELTRKASRFAAEMTKELHFEYAGFAKPKALRTPLGSILGQFSTYSINWFNYQRKLAVNGYDAALARDWQNPAIRRVAYMGIQSFLLNGILSGIFNVNTGNIIQDATKDRLEQFMTFFDPDATDEDKKRTFFGKGPVLGTIGGPFVSDLVTLGQVSGLLEMDEGDFLSYVAGYTDKGDDRQTDAMKEVTRIINTSLYRLIYQHKQNMTDGVGIPTILGNELALYGDKTSRKARSGLNELIGAKPTRVKKKEQKYISSVTPAGPRGGQLSTQGGLGGQLTPDKSNAAGYEQEALMRLLDSMGK